MSSLPDWISAVSSIMAIAIGAATLLTVYIGAMQLLSQNRMYRLGLSRRSLGPWQSMVARSALLGLQRRIFTPNVSLKSLVRNQWKPSIIFPMGFSKSGCPERGDNVQAKSSWVNFMQALNLSPSHDALFEMQDASELVNGVVPMHWTGKDLVGMCSILGFQSHEKEPSFKSPMPLPMQWSGPLGWLQFRSSPNGCVTEFRRRMELHNQISKDLHDHQKLLGADLAQESYFLRSRLWNSINGFSLRDGWTLFLGGASKEDRLEEADDDTTQVDMFEDLMATDLTDEEIRRKLFGKKENRPEALRREMERGGAALPERKRDPDLPDFLNSMLRDTLDSCNKKQVLRPCPGLLSVNVQGELAYNRGLSIAECREYDRKYTEAEDVDHHKYPYHLGDLYMDKELLGWIKEALLLLRPDGFYFSPTYHLYRDLCEVYQHIKDYSNKVKVVFFAGCIPSMKELRDHMKNTTTAAAATTPYERRACLYFAMALCNDLQRTLKMARACFSVDDMRLLARTTSALNQILPTSAGHVGHDLVWAMLYCPKLSPDVLKLLKTDSMEAFLDAEVVSKDGVLDCSALFAVNIDEAEDEKTGKYEIPLLDDGKFTGEQLLAALCTVLITYFWIATKWTTDVAAYDTTMPQSILMC